MSYYRGTRRSTENLTKTAPSPLQLFTLTCQADVLQSMVDWKLVWLTMLKDVAKPDSEAGSTKVRYDQHTLWMEWIQQIKECSSKFCSHKRKHESVVYSRKGTRKANHITMVTDQIAGWAFADDHEIVKNATEKGSELVPWLFCWLDQQQYRELSNKWHSHVSGTGPIQGTRRSHWTSSSAPFQLYIVKLHY